jgi:hypothetical protein
MARLMLASGPLMALCWGPSLIAAKAWTWPVPRPAAAAYALAFFAVVASLLVAASSRHSVRRTRLGLAGGLGPHRTRRRMVAAAIAFAPVFVWPMALAILASLARIGLGYGCCPRLGPPDPRPNQAGLVTGVSSTAASRFSLSGSGRW